MIIIKYIIYNIYDHQLTNQSFTDLAQVPSFDTIMSSDWSVHCPITHHLFTHCSYIPENEPLTCPEVCAFCNNMLSKMLLTMFVLALESMLDPLMAPELVHCSSHSSPRGVWPPVEPARPPVEPARTPDKHRVRRWQNVRSCWWAPWADRVAQRQRRRRDDSAETGRHDDAGSTARRPDNWGYLCARCRHRGGDRYCHLLSCFTSLLFFVSMAPTGIFHSCIWVCFCMCYSFPLSSVLIHPPGMLRPAPKLTVINLDTY